jgi:hypothetical protein
MQQSLDFTLDKIWTAAAVFLGFQINAFIWRLNREIGVEQFGGRNWLPPADYLSLASLLVIVVGVYAFPLAGIKLPLTPAEMFGLSVILFVGYVFALLSHYNLLFRGPTRLPGLFCTWQEFVTILFVLAAAAFYITEVRCQCMWAGGMS